MAGRPEGGANDRHPSAPHHQVDDVGAGEPADPRAGGIGDADLLDAVAEAAPLFGDGVEEIGVTDPSGARVGRLSRTDVVELMMRG